MVVQDQQKLDVAKIGWAYMSFRAVFQILRSWKPYLQNYKLMDAVLQQL